MYPTRKGWKQITSGRIYNLYAEAFEYARALQLWKGANPPLYTRKSVRALGTCFTNKNDSGGVEAAIVLNEILLNYSDDQIRKTIVHEVAHAVCPLHHHDSYWHEIANTLGARWGYEIEHYDTDPELCEAIAKLKLEKSPYKYELYCPVCGVSYKYKRACEAVRNPSRYWCPKDKTTLKSRKI